jgi:hypothetical protein
MVIVNYTRVGEPVSDFEAENFAANLITLSEGYFAVSSELVIVAIRTLISENRLSHKHVQLQYEGREVVELDHNGRIIHNPVGFCHHYDDFLDRMLKL